MYYFFKKYVGGIVFAVFLVEWISNASGDIWGQTTAAKWKNNKQGALSLTFDDNSWDRNTQAGILEEYGLRGTFYVVTGELPEYAGMFTNIFLRGHEIGSHSVTHPSMSSLTLDQIRDELKISKATIEALTGVPCVSFTYPYGDSPEIAQPVMGEYYLSARGSIRWLPDCPNVPVNGIGQGTMFLLTQGPSPEFGGDTWTDQQYLDIQKQYTQVVLDAHGWGINMFHDLAWPEHDQNDSLYVRASFLRAYCQDLATGTGSSLWVAPQGTVARYYLEWLGTTIQTISETEDTKKIHLNFNGDPALFNEPLTLLTEILTQGQGKEFTITQGGLPLNYRIVQAGAQTLLMYDALPGGRVVTLQVGQDVPSIVMDTEAVTVPENDTASFRVKLSYQPSSTITVTAGRVSGDCDISVQSGSVLTFTPQNWDAYQTVTVFAVPDPDIVNGQAILCCSSPGLPEKEITVNELDNQPTPSILTDKETVTVPENGTADFQVKLSFEPSLDVQVSVDRVRGSADLNVQAGAAITFTPQNWDTFQTVTLAATGDPDIVNGQAILCCSSPGLPDKEISVNELDNTTSEILIDTDLIDVTENGTASFRVKLSYQPSSTITVTVGRVSGDQDFSIQSGSVLTFTPQNWDVYQTVTVFAALDPDIVNGQAILCCSSPGLPEKEITVNEVDNQPTPSILTDKETVTVPENGTADFQVKLSFEPSLNVQVSVDRVRGSADLNVQAGAAITFTPQNWDTFQTVTLAAAGDPDADNEQAVFRCSSKGLPNKEVTADEQDNQPSLPVIPDTPISKGDAVLSVEPDQTEKDWSAGNITFTVKNTGEGTMNWTSEVTDGGSWLSILSGSFGTDNGTVTAQCKENSDIDNPRTAMITFMAEGSVNSPKVVTIIQAKKPTGNLLKIDIMGPNQMDEKSTAPFDCTATYDDGRTNHVTLWASWSVDSQYATINNEGVLVTKEVPSDQPCRITATYQGKTTSIPIIIHAPLPLSSFQDINSSEVNVNDGQTAPVPSDYIPTSCGGVGFVVISFSLYFGLSLTRRSRLKCL